MLGIGLAASARGEGFDPFATTWNGFDAVKPSLETYAASLPPATSPAGREVRVELVERETSVRAKSLVLPVEPPGDLAPDAERDLPSVRVKLNTAGWVERREWVTHDPSGKALAEPLWTGRVLCVRPEETNGDGAWFLRVVYCATDFEGWVEEKGVYQPVLARRVINTQLALPAGRWLALGNGGVSKAGEGGTARERATMLWVRVTDVAAPAAGPADPRPLVAEPATITPAAR